MTKHTRIFWAVEFVCVIVIGVVLSTASPRAKWWSLVPAAVIMSIKIREYFYNIRQKTNEVRYQLEVLMRLLPTGGSRVRCTYHRPVHSWYGNRTSLVQAFDYIPQGGGGGRSFPSGKGIIGRVYVDKAARVENFASDVEYRERMVAEYNYTASEVARRAADRRSYICYPIIDERHEVLGLIFLDSDTPNTFTLNPENEKWIMIRGTGEVIQQNILASQ